MRRSISLRQTSVEVQRREGRRDSADNDREDRRRRKRGPQILRWGQVARTNVIGSFTLSNVPRIHKAREGWENRLKLKPLMCFQSSERPSTFVLPSNRSEDQVRDNARQCQHFEATASLNGNRIHSTLSGDSLLRLKWRTAARVHLF